MPRRCSALVSIALLLALMFPGSAHAHRLDAQAFVLKDHRVQIEAWFPGGPAAGARVQVFRTGAALLTEGQTNEDGIFIFSFTQPEILRVVISDEAGHRKELSLSPNDLGVILADRDAGFPIKDVVVGIGFLLALAAFFLSLRNARRLRELEDRKKG